MPERRVIVVSKVGLHARPAAVFAQAAAAMAPLRVTIGKDGAEPVAASSILSLMALGARHGDVVTIAAEGEGAEAALDKLASLLASDLDG